jgi:hypothetical protein
MFNLQVAEFSASYELLGRQDGVFKSMCMKSSTFHEFKVAAKAKWEKDLT